MYWIVCLLILLLTGCQGMTLFDRGEDASTSIMPLWNHYRQCLETTEPAALLRTVEHFEQVRLMGPEPPAWMKSWGAHVKRQPLRTSVDPYALGAACTIRTAMLLAQRDRLPEAQALYRRVVSHYPRQDWPYFHEQAREALSLLSLNDPAVVALQSTLASPRTP